MEEIKVGQIRERTDTGKKFIITSINEDAVYFRYLEDNSMWFYCRKNIRDYSRLIEDVRPESDGSIDDAIVEGVKGGGETYDDAIMEGVKGGGETYQNITSDYSSTTTACFDGSLNLSMERDNFNNIKETEMEKPETKLEKQACEEAREEIVAETIEDKKRIYKQVMEQFIEIEREARASRKQADELREKLGVTDKQMEQIFEE